MTEKQLKACHRGLWKWWGKHPNKNKEDWPGWKLAKKYSVVGIVDGPNFSHCFACYDATAWCVDHGLLDSFSSHPFDVTCPVCPISVKAGQCVKDRNSLWRKVCAARTLDHTNPERWKKLCEEMANAWD